MTIFRKINIFIILFFILFNVNSYSEVVNKVAVQGNERISLETIVIFGDIAIGQNYESEDINLLIKKLYETNFFSNISIELRDGRLNIIVKENPIINSLVLKGEKAEKYRTTITEKLILREKTSFLENYIKSDINKIKSFYRLLGFYFVEIEVETERLEKNKVNLVYSINKKEKAKISKIYFLGEKKIRDKRLRDVITSQEATFWKFISRNVYLNKKSRIRQKIIKKLLLIKKHIKNYYIAKNK